MEQEGAATAATVVSEAELAQEIGAAEVVEAATSAADDAARDEAELGAGEHLDTGQHLAQAALVEQLQFGTELVLDTAVVENLVEARFFSQPGAPHQRGVVGVKRVLDTEHFA